MIVNRSSDRVSLYLVSDSRGIILILGIFIDTLYQIQECLF